MRQTYETRKFTFDNPVLKGEVWPSGPTHIILHRQGNPGAKALNALQWGNRTGTFSIHCYIEDEVCYEAVEANVQAFHVKETKWARAWGFPTPNGRGDYLAYGIETVDIPGGAPGQEYSLSQDTRITLLLAVRDVCQQFNIHPDNVFEHADFDPVTRSEDLGDALNLQDFRQDLIDLMEGREPWRTVGEFATGTRAPNDWKPMPPPEPQKLTLHTGKLFMGKLDGGVFGKGAFTDIPCTGFVRFTFSEHPPIRPKGIDIDCPHGSPLRAITSGTVTLSGIEQASPIQNDGAIIILSDDRRHSVSYRHIDTTRPFALAGTRVEAGELIGYSGGTPGTPGAGISEFPHLHLGIQAVYRGVNNDTYIDPLGPEVEWVEKPVPVITLPPQDSSRKSELVKKLEEALELAKELS